MGHIARFCKTSKRPGAEESGRQKHGSSSRQSQNQSRQVQSAQDLIEHELEKELSRHRADKEQKLLDTQGESGDNLVTGAVGSSYWLSVTVEGVGVSAFIDTGSQSTIISCVWPREEGWCSSPEVVQG